MLDELGVNLDNGLDPKPIGQLIKKLFVDLQRLFVIRDRTLKQQLDVQLDRQLVVNEEVFKGLKALLFADLELIDVGNDVLQRPSCE